MFTKVTVLIVVIMMATAVGVAQAGVLFSDNFDTSVPTWDVNLENAARQSGSVGNLNYLENLAHPDWKTRVNDTVNGDPAGMLTLAANGGLPDWVWVSPNHNFIESSSFGISFDIKPCFYTIDGDMQQWGGLIFGSSSMGQYAWATDGFSLAMRGNGDFHWWDGSAASGEVDTASTNGNYHIDITVDAPAWGSDANLKLYVDGTKYLDIVRAGGFSANKISLIGETYTVSSHAFDNLVVSGADVPEPSAMLSLMAACAAGGLTALRRRISR